MSNKIWTEKYRPRNLDEFVCSESQKNKFKSYITEQNIPHILCSGPPGSGKTSLAKILTKLIDCNSIYINASDERSIETLRTKIKEFAISLGSKPLKICILDEFDGANLFMMQALRPIMETTADQTRFILTCNYPQKIIDPIKSRCQLFEFKSFTKEMIEKRLKQILSQEKIEYKDKDIEQIALYSYPDIRRAINFCQKYVIDSKLIYTKDENLESVNGMIYDLLKKKDWRSIRKLVNNESIIYEDVYKFLFDRMEDPKSLLTIAEYLRNHSIVADPEINFIAMVIELLD